MLAPGNELRRDARSHFAESVYEAGGEDLPRSRNGEERHGQERTQHTLKGDRRRAGSGAAADRKVSG